jgi:PAS domain S-box-containing protein
MNRWPRLLVVTGVLATLGLLTLNAVLTYTNLGTVADRGRRVGRTRQVIAEVRRILLLLTDAETGQRGYLLTGREDYLEPYRHAIAEVAGTLDRLAALTATDPRQQERLRALRRLAAAKLSELERTIVLRQDRGLDAALAVVRTEQGKRLMDAIRDTAGALEDDAEAGLERQETASRLAIQRTVATFSLATTVAIALLLAVISLKRRDDDRLARSAEAVRRSESWLATTLASIGDAVIATDARGHVRFLNPAAEALTGWPQAEAAGQPIETVFQIVNESTGEPTEHPVARVLREGVNVGLANHTVVVARDGRATPIEDSAAPIRDEAGAVAGAVMVFQDATVRRRLMADLRAAKAEAEEANRIKDDFLAALSHELRTPLNPILLATTAALQRPGPDPDELRPTLELVRRNVELQARLIDDLLDITRIVRGKLPLVRAIVDAHTLVREAVAITRGELESKGHRLELDLSAEDPWVDADPARLQQVFWNLLKNAVKFTPEGGAIVVRTRNLGAELVIEVADTGIGMGPEALSTVFDAFHQGGAGITRKYGGLGLGLTICRGVVEAHGGTIAAESPGPGRGATFRVALATSRQPVLESSDRTTGPGTRTESGPLRILVVEDEPATLRIMGRLLRGLGHRVVTADSVAGAWNAVRQAGGGFDLVISDVGLPDGSGLDLVQRIRAERPVPAIALTGYGMDDDVRRSHEAGFAAHMTKPIDFAKLEAVIREVTSPDLAKISEEVETSTWPSCPGSRGIST